MTLSNTLVDMVKKFEGFRSHPYKDIVGVPTIGYGSTYYMDGTKVSVSDDPITEEAATDLLKHKLEKFCSEVQDMVTVDLTQNQLDALTDFAYNLGSGSLKTSTLLAKLNNGDADGAAEEFAKWTHAGGRVLQALVERREAEKALFLSSTGKEE